MSYADWSKAPEGAIFHTVDAHGTGEWWVKMPRRGKVGVWRGMRSLADGFIEEYHHGNVADWCNSLERRPADYLDIPKGSARYRAIADSIDAGEGPESFEHRPKHGEFSPCPTWQRVAEARRIRRKPTQRMTWIEGPGGRYEYPEPMREAPNAGTEYHVPDTLLGYGGNITAIWRGGISDVDRLNAGIVHGCPKSARLHARASILASGGSVDVE